METFYVFVVIVLFVLAISDLMVGVSNDAVNFLNSAIGSKVARFRVIMLVAALGVLVGATFSSGMMEVARKGIMHPDMFVFGEIILIFLAVMMTDVLLLDLYNTFGLPTSTTVSIVFELLGASVAIASIKMIRLDQPLAEMGMYINTSKALAIIAGILLSVVIAFLIGALIQYLTRVLFSFKIDKSYRRFGGIFGGLAFTIILYFMLIKGAKGASFMSDTNVAWIKQHTTTLLLICLLGSTALFQLLIWFTKVNVLRIIVLAGTFSLAMAFAGNDLVNFIGVPLAGLESLKTFLADPVGDPDGLFMTALKGPVKTPTYLLALAGLIMVLTLLVSKKARSVTKTTIDLSRQESGYERFESTGFSRAIVRFTRSFNTFSRRLIPEKVIKGVESRFDRTGIPNDPHVSFDLVRASINLVVAAILIAFGTSLKLPLSTTYVTFMVAMGTSLADRAWGRESAVYRITGVLVVIMGWFVTAFLAFTSAFIMAYLLHYGGLVAILLLIALAIFMILRSQIIHKKRTEKQQKAENDALETDSILEKRLTNAQDIISRYDQIYNNIITGLCHEKRKKLNKTNKELASIRKEIKDLRLSIPSTIRSLGDDEFDAGYTYVQILDYLKETNYCLIHLARPVFEHVDNNLPGLGEKHCENLNLLRKAVSNMDKALLAMMEKRDPDLQKEVAQHQTRILELIQEIETAHLKKLKKERISTHISVLFVGILRETRGYTLFLHNLAKSLAKLI